MVSCPFEKIATQGPSEERVSKLQEEMSCALKEARFQQQLYEGSQDEVLSLFLAFSRLSGIHHSFLCLPMLFSW